MWHLRQWTESLAGQRDFVEMPASVADLRCLLRGMPTCMLTTRSDDVMRTRPMMLRTIDPDGRLLFFASQRSHVTAHLAAHPQVSITFVHPDHGLYVAVSGTGAIASDPTLIRPLWNWSYRVWYPHGWRDPHLVLLTVAVTQLEFWCAPSTRAMRLARSIQASLTHTSYTDAKHGILIVDPPP